MVVAEDRQQDDLTDSILDVLGDEKLPSSQVQFQEQVDERVKRSRLLQDGGQTSTPLRDNGRRTTEEKGGRGGGEKTRRSRARRSVADQLKRTMLGNAASPGGVCRVAAALKEAVVSEEISVAVQAMETVSTETPDLGPFYGLPSKVKDLMHKLRGISSLYGDALFIINQSINNQNLQKHKVTNSNVSKLNQIQFYSEIEKNSHLVLIVFVRLCVRLAGDVSEPGLRPAAQEPDLLSSHQRRKDSGG